MAGYNRGIVATRKLNKKNKARLGRGGDTEIRKVEGKDSHVNALEAYLIDVNNKAGERYAKRVGAGTTNPLTGMPEYHAAQEGFEHDDTGHTHGTKEQEAEDGTIITVPDYDTPRYTEQQLGLEQNVGALEAGLGTYSPGEGQLSYEEYTGLSEKERNAYLGEFDVGAKQTKYISPFETRPFEILQQEKEMAFEGAELAERGLGLAKRAAAREAEVASAGVGETYRGARESLGKQFSAGSRAIGQSMTQARAGAESAAARSGFARSGTVTGAMGQQMKALTQDYGQLQADYTGGLGTAARQADISRAGIAAGQKTAGESYAQGMRESKLGRQTAELDFTTGTYNEQQRQMDKLWRQIGTVSQTG